jgi:5-hydroxyisourate hydrolase/2-oxo-4-hydroxy-4-carboxy-5-ureidoimidazoline decarboxylase
MLAFNACPRAELVSALVAACHARAWAERVADARPFGSLEVLIASAADAWFALGASGAWVEAFAAHGSLGACVAEQADAMRAADSTPFEAANAAYEARHGHKCITFAANKSAERLLDEVVSRTPLHPDTEMRRCAEQTSLITALRLCRIVSSLAAPVSSSPQAIWPSDADARIVSPVTTHILDTSLGCPARGVTIRMERQTASGSWCPLATGSTNSDGRVTDLLPGFYDTARLFTAGIYRLTFDVAGYYAGLEQDCFYPDVVIAFRVVDPTQHYHVPLLLNPYGYSTYRGS